MTYTYNNKGTCSVRTVVELNDDHTIKARPVAASPPAAPTRSPRH